MKICKNCKEYKSALTFPNGRNFCRDCINIKQRDYLVKNKIKFDNYHSEYRKNNKSKINQAQKEYREKYPDKIKDCKRKSIQKNKEYSKLYCKKYNQINKKEISKNKKLYYALNKNKISIKSANNKKQRRINDIPYKLRDIISTSIRNSLKYIGVSKNKKSCWNYLPYSKDELRAHIEFLFEPWMNWQNHGIYSISDWDDNDKLTWKWQIDHIIPHSTFQYRDMECEDFKKCWALSNLRPLSAKQNILDGVSKIRHRKIIGE